MQRKIILLFTAFLLMNAKPVFPQSFTVKLMCWNLLNYPDPTSAAATAVDTTLRHPYYKTVTGYVNPDILITEENTSATATTWFLNDVMNVNGAVYSKGTFINGPDTDNEVYYKTSEFSFLSNTKIRTDLRDINEFKLVHISTNDTIRIYAVHLKASSGVANEAQRAQEADSLRKFTNVLPAGTNFVVCGDFNIYGDYESAYQKLLLDNIADDGNFVDPITMTGIWNNSSYSAYHTQSTRTASFGGGATGGMNDRFDMILFSTAISQGLNGIHYQPGSTTPVGNDGNHYNQALNVLPNNAAPSAVIDALYYAADHLPVTVLLNFSSVTDVAEVEKNDVPVLVFPNPFSQQVHLKFLKAEPVPALIRVMNVLGEEVMSLKKEFYQNNETEFNLSLPSDLAKGIYLLRIQVGNDFHSIKLVRQ
ncbi:MAG: T9SS type A sorting domain-containing protein [Bacteroidetes bacterium]|nr:T9SS type A sorting domain-containing protein [Bacteroidota bacterium]